MNNQPGSKDILKARAAALARPVKAERSKGDELEVVEFRLARERYAIERSFVRTVVPLENLTMLPGVPAFIPGIINLSGQIVPLIDIKKFFELPETGITDLHMVIVVHAGDVELGILADSIAGVVMIPTAVIQPSLPTLTGIRSQYLKGVTDQLLVILDAAKILGDPKIVVNEAVRT